MNHAGTVIFFGNERLATGVTTTAPTLRALIAAGFKVLAVVSHYEQASSRTSRDLEIADVAKQHNIPVLLPHKPADIIDILKGYSPEIGVLVAYGKIVPQSVIDIFPKGIINIHPSALPKHRGPTPLESVILNGESSTAVSIMQLASTMDAGPVYIQENVNLTNSETKQELADTLLAIGSRLITELLPRTLAGSISPKPQNDADATFDTLIKKEDGCIDWTKPAEQIEREIRAYATWPKSYTQFNGLDVVVTKASVLENTNEKLELGVPYVTEDNMLAIACGAKSLCIQKLKPAGKPEMDASSFINGYRKYLD